MLVVVCGVAIAQEMSEDVIQNRIGNFRDIGSAYKNIRDELKSGRPDIGKIHASAKTIAGYAPHVVSWFPKGSEPSPEPPQSWLEWIRSWFATSDDAGTDGALVSHAKSEIWSNPKLFRADAAKFAAQASVLDRIAQGGNIAATAGEYRRLGETCSSCHTVFRRKLH